jgi:hypothetical protein
MVHGGHTDRDSLALLVRLGSLAVWTIYLSRFSHFPAEYTKTLRARTNVEKKNIRDNRTAQHYAHVLDLVLQCHRNIDIDMTLDYFACDTANVR